MKAAFRRLSGWALALLLASIAGSCSSASKAAASSSGDNSEDTSVPVSPGRKDGKSDGDGEKQLPEARKPDKNTDPGRIRLMYGVPVTDFRKIEE